MGTAVGSVDELRRPLVRILRVGSEDSFVALVDTGFNGDLLRKRPPIGFRKAVVSSKSEPISVEAFARSEKSSSGAASRLR